MNNYELAFYIISFVIVISALAVVFLKNIFYNALFLILHFIGVAAIFILLSADFLAATQILIFIGAVSLLLLFAIMLVSLKPLSEANLKSAYFKPALLVSAIFFFLISFFLIKDSTLFPINKNSLIATGSTAFLGKLLLTDYLLPFEIISLVLLVTLVGAIVIARKQ